MTWLGLAPATLALVAAVSALAFAVRGLTGFGSAMIGVGALTLVLPPAQVVPAFLALELATTVNLLPSIWRLVDWRSLPWLLAGCALATPLGMQALAHLPADPMRLLVSGCLLGVALLMLSGLASRWQRGRPPAAGAFATGAASGLLNGAAGVGGPPVVVFYFATASTAVSRASLIAYFLITDVYALAWAAGQGLFQAGAGPLVAVALLPGLLGLWGGSRLYSRLDEATLRRLVWWLLALLGFLGCAAVLSRAL